MVKAQDVKGAEREMANYLTQVQNAILETVENTKQEYLESQLNG